MNKRSHSVLVHVNPGKIIYRVCDAYDLPKERLLSPDRAQHVAWARKVAAWLMSQFTVLGDQEIGRILKRDRSTICYSIGEVRRIVEAGLPIGLGAARVRDEIAREEMNP